MSKAIKPTDLSAAIAEKLALYHENVTNSVNAAGEKAAKDLVKKTKRTAPVLTGDYKRSIAWKAIDKGLGHKIYVWYVKAPNYRLTHLLVKGHAKLDGGRTTPDLFLQNALDTVMPEYEREIEEAIKNA